MTNHPERRLIRDYPLPAKLYKFTKKEFAKPILTGQSIRIGTLREFTKTEERQLNKGDRNEGTVNVAGGKFTISSDSSPGLHKFLSASGYEVENMVVDAPCSTEAVTIVIDNMNILCLSTDPAEEIAKDLDEAYDTCIEIDNPARFIDRMCFALYTHLESHVEVSAGPVKYTPRTLQYDSVEFEIGPHLKDVRFQTQKEFRLVFKHQEKVVQPLIIPFDPSGCNMKVKW